MAGRPPGSKNAKTERWLMFEGYMLTGGLAKFQVEMDKLHGKDFVYAMIAMMEYFKPKLGRIELPISGLPLAVLTPEQQEQRINQLLDEINTISTARRIRESNGQTEPLLLGEAHIELPASNRTTSSGNL